MLRYFICKKTDGIVKMRFSVKSNNLEETNEATNKLLRDIEGAGVQMLETTRLGYWLYAIFGNLIIDKLPIIETETPE